MADMKFQAGDPVFFYTMIDRIPGVIDSVQKNEHDKWIYSIKVGSTMIARNVAENYIEVRKITDTPKYKHGDKVLFVASEKEQYKGTIEIVDPYGTFEQSEEPSYDILVKGNPDCLFKHIRESKVIGFSE